MGEQVAMDPTDRSNSNGKAHAVMDDLGFLAAQAYPAISTRVSMRLKSWGRTLLEIIGIGGLFVLLITMAGLMLRAWALLAPGSLH
jgi:hypothetical protein